MNNAFTEKLIEQNNRRFKIIKMKGTQILCLGLSEIALLNRLEKKIGCKILDLLNMAYDQGAIDAFSTLDDFNVNDH